MSEEMGLLKRVLQILIPFLYMSTVYAQTGPQVSIRTSPPGPPFPVAIWIHFSCNITSLHSVTYEWTGHCITHGIDEVLFRSPNRNDSGVFSIRTKSSPLSCVTTVVCTATDSSGNTQRASVNITNVTGVGFFGTSQPISNNSVFTTNAAGRIGTIFCHSASRDGHIGRWISPDGRNITSDSNDTFQIRSFSGPHPSYTTLQFAEGSTFTAAEQGIYSCVIPDETGTEQTLNVGIYPDGNQPAQLDIFSIRRTSENPITISCNTSGLPLTSVYWYKGAQELTSGSAYTMSQPILHNRRNTTYSALLTINDLTTGVHSCIAQSEISGLATQSRPGFSNQRATPTAVREYFAIYIVGHSRSFRFTDRDGTRIELLRDNVVILTSMSSSFVVRLSANDSIHHQVYVLRSYRPSETVEQNITVIIQVPESAVAVTVQTSEDGSLGERHTLTCIASETVDGLTNRATAQWLDQDGNVINSGEGIVVDGPSIQPTVIFDPLQTSHAGNYTCQATLSSPALSLPLVKTAQTNVIVQVPTPTVFIDTPSSGPLFAGSALTLTCLIQVDATVDTPVNINAGWRKNGASVRDNRITTSSTQQISSHTYRQTLTISSLSKTTDTGDYSCTASVSSSSPSPFISGPSETTVATHSITQIQAPTLTVNIGQPPLGRILNIPPYNEFSLTCTASAPDGVTVSKLFQWTRTLAGSNTTTQLTDDGDSVRITNSNQNSPTSTSVLTVREDTAGIYTYQCSALIQVPDDPNISMASSAVQVRVTGPRVPSSPLNVAAVPVNFTSVLVQWTVAFIAYTAEQYYVKYGTNTSALTLESRRISSGSDISHTNQVYSIHLTGLQRDTTYFIQVVATNFYGAASSQINLFTIEDIPVIVAITAEGPETVGETLTLTCMATEEEDLMETLQVAWLDQMGQPLSSAGDVSVGGPTIVGNTVTLTLTFNPLKVSHDGRYTCQATVEGTGVTESATHDVVISVQALRVTITSTSTEYSAASPLTLTCGVPSGAFEPVTFQWSSTCSGSCFVNGQTSASVMQTALRSIDSGVHTCTATDSVENTGNASVEIRVVGFGLYSSSSGQIANNSVITANSDGSIDPLECISGSTSPGVGRWIDPNGQDLTFQSGDDFDVTVGGQENPGYVRLSLSQVTPSNQGVYTCVIPDENGAEQTIHVGIYPRDFSAPISIVSVGRLSPAGSLFTLNCTSTGSPATSVSWTLDNRSISVSGIYEMVQVLRDGSTATYDNLLVVDANPGGLIGTYSCMVGNAIEAFTETLMVSGLQILWHLDVFLVGERRGVRCLSDLHVTSIEWLYGGLVVALSNSHGLQHLDLQFNPVNDSISNREYTCRVTSPYGIQEHTITLLVEVVPVNFNVTIQTNATNLVLAGQSITLTCTVMTTQGLQSPPSVEWLDSTGSNVASGGGITLEGPVRNTADSTTTLVLLFSPLQLSHGGEFTCRANISSPAPPYSLSKLAEWDLIVSTTCIRIFQLFLREVHDCVEWRFEDTSEKLSDIIGSVTADVAENCQCPIAQRHIDSGEFLCTNEDSHVVVFRARLEGSEEDECRELLSGLTEWAEGGQATVLIQNNRISVDPSCMTEIQSFSDAAECSTTTMATTISTTATTISTTATTIFTTATTIFTTATTIFTTATTIFTTATCTRIFQLFLREVHDCAEWRFEDTGEKLSDIIGSVTAGVAENCQCPIAQHLIDSGEFLCTNEDSHVVVFRARITGNVENECTQLLSHIEDWVEEKHATVLIQSNRLSVNPSCMLEIQSLGDPVDCSQADGSTGKKKGGKTGAAAIGAGIGGAVGTTVVVIIIVVTVLSYIHVARRNEQRRSQGTGPNQARGSVGEYVENTEGPYSYICDHESYEMKSPRPPLPPLPLRPLERVPAESVSSEYVTMKSVTVSMQGAENEKLEPLYEYIDPPQEWSSADED